MPHVLIVHESESVRSEITREFQAEGFTVAEADCASAAVREIWQGTFDAVVLGDKVGGPVKALEDQIHQLAPEVVTVTVDKSESPARLARRVADILDGAVAA